MNMPVEAAMVEYLYQKASASGSPISGTFELTPLCNMNCSMCYVRLSKEEQTARGELKSAEEWLNLARRCKDAGMLFLLITGGEPFTHPEIRTIIEELHRMGFILTINTNGTMIDEETVSWLKKVPPARINVTLYGADNDTYKRLCRCPDGFSKADKAIMLLKENGINIKINCSVTPYNADDLPEIISYAKRNEIVIQPTAYMFPSNKKSTETNNEFRFSPEKAAYYTAYIDYLINGKDKFLSFSKDAVIPADNDDNCGKTGEGIKCRAGKCSFWITWDGQILPCGMFPRNAEKNAFEGSFDELWAYTKDMTDKIRLPADCAECRLKKECRACAAMVISENGCFDKAPEYRCRYVSSFYTERNRLINEITHKEDN
ncbi:MAG: radical SAM protein [Clostridia bacterium]|nr:radical SAM protein [Clostridia bacterium]